MFFSFLLNPQVNSERDMKSHGIMCGNKKCNATLDCNNPERVRNYEIETDTVSLAHLASRKFSTTFITMHDSWQRHRRRRRRHRRHHLLYKYICTNELESD